MKKDADLELGQKLKAAREYLGFSQLNVANRLGRLSRSAISLIEAGQRKVSATELVELAAIYETPVADITGEEFETNFPEEIDVVARHMKKLSKQDQAEIVRFTKLLLSKKSP